MKADKYAAIRLKNQMCFPLYACSKEIVRRYKPYLDQIDLTYTQYIVMMVLWEENDITVSELGKKLYLDSGTLTPVLKKLEQKKLLTRTRMKNDERVLCISVTDKGNALKEEALEIPAKMSNCLNLDKKEAEFLYSILHKMLEQFEE